jgi:hypothetical protein
MAWNSSEEVWRDRDQDQPNPTNGASDSAIDKGVWAGVVVVAKGLGVGHCHDMASMGETSDGLPHV